jgi:hypothetical protein
MLTPALAAVLASVPCARVGDSSAPGGPSRLANGRQPFCERLAVRPELGDAGRWGELCTRAQLLTL